MSKEVYNIKDIYKATDCLTESQMIDYVDGKMSAKEAHAVETHLIDCPICSDAVEGIQMMGTAAFTQKLQSIQYDKLEVVKSAPAEGKVVDFKPNTETKPSAPKSKGKTLGLGTYFSIAAAVAILVTFAFIFMGGRVTKDSIFEEHFSQEYLDLARSDVDTGAISKDVSAAKVLMSEKNWDGALAELSTKVGVDAELLRGDCFLNKNDLDGAAKAYLAASKAESSEDALRGEFKYGLVLVKQGKVTEAKDVLSALAKNPKCPNSEEVTQILEQIEKL